MNRRASRETGSAWATWMLVIFGLLVLAAIVFPLFARCRVRVPDKAYLCTVNLNQIGKAVEMYKMAWDDHMPILSTTGQRAPEGKAWPDLIALYLRQIEGDRGSGVPWHCLRCPDSAGDRMDYSLNRRIQGLSVVGMDQAETIQVFESVNGSTKNNNLNGDTISRPLSDNLPATGSFVDWPSENQGYYSRWPEWARMRHRGTDNVLWADGHVSSLATYRQRRDPQRWPLQFDPKLAKENAPPASNISP